MKSVRLEANKEKEQIREEYGEQIQSLEDTAAAQLQQVQYRARLRQNHLEIFLQIGKLQNELNSLKEFSRKRASMQQEIERVSSIEDANHSIFLCIYIT